MAKKRKSSMRDKVRKNVERQQSENKGFGYLNLPNGIKQYNPKSGDREYFDIFPYEVTDSNHPDRDDENEIAVKGDIWYRRPFKIHRNVGALKETLVCPTSIGKKCPECEYRAKRKDEGADKKELEMYYTSNRNLYAVIPRDNKDYEEDFHIFDMSQYTFQNQLNEEINENEKYGDFAELEGGYTLSVRWREKPIGNNKFIEASSIKFEKREDYEDDILDDVPNLDECLKILSYEEYEAKFFDMEEPEEEEEKNKKEERRNRRREKDENEETQKTSRSSHRRKKDEYEEETERRDSRRNYKKLTWEDIDDMEEQELVEVINSKDLDIEPDDYDIPDLKIAIAEELDIEIEKKKDSKRARSSRNEKTSKRDDGNNNSSDKQKCPHGLKFGVDVDTDDVCDTCKIWRDCDEEKERNK